MTRGQRATLLWALVALSAGGWLLHSRIHPLKTGPEMVVPIVAACADTVVVTVLFLSRRSARLAYLLNGLLVIYGITIMTQFGLVRNAGLGVLPGLIAMAGDCAILFGDFMVGKALFDGYFAEDRAGVRPWMFLAPGWWLVHFTLIPAVYTVGHAFWR